MYLYERVREKEMGHVTLNIHPWMRHGRYAYFNESRHTKYTSPKKKVFTAEKERRRSSLQGGLGPQVPSPPPSTPSLPSLELHCCHLCWCWHCGMASLRNRVSPSHATYVTYIATKPSNSLSHEHSRSNTLRNGFSRKENFSSFLPTMWHTSLHNSLNLSLTNPLALTHCRIASRIKRLSLSLTNLMTQIARELPLSLSPELPRSQKLRIGFSKKATLSLSHKFCDTHRHRTHELRLSWTPAF